MAVLVYMLCFITPKAVAELLDNAVDEVNISCPLPSLDGTQSRSATFLTSPSSRAMHACFGFLLNSLLLKHRYHMVLPEC